MRWQMAEYKRIVSYFYEYANGKKGGLAGHGKIEQKGSKLRFSIDCDCSQIKENAPLMVYVFWKDGKRMQTSPIGSLYGKGQKGHFETQGEVNALLPQGISLGQLDGIVMYTNPRIFCATIWSDLVLEADSFVNEDSESQEDKKVNKQEDKVTELKKEEREEEEPIEKIIGKIATVKDNVPKSDEKLSEEKKNDGEEQVAVTKMPLNKGEKKKELQEESIELEKESEENNVQGNTNIPVMQEKMEEFIRELEARIQPETAGHLREYIKRKESLRTQAREKMGTGIFEQFLLEYPRVNHFGNPAFMKCVRITPQDIGKLPRWNWHIGTNSFAMHGFSEYKYLLCGYIKNGYDKKDKIIGVPGVYSSEDNYLAGIFGFNQFIPAKKSSYKTGEFGYWIMEIVENQ